MPRNLDKRIELLFRGVAGGRQKVLLALDAIFQDNVKGRRLQADGAYKRRRPARGEEAYRSQIELHREAKRVLDRAPGSGQAPPAGPQWVSRLAPLEPQALAYDKPLCASLDGFTLHAATRSGALDPAGREALLL